MAVKGVILFILLILIDKIVGRGLRLMFEAPNGGRGGNLSRASETLPYCREGDIARMMSAQHGHRRMK
jgi:hypothetical protein